MKINWYTKSDDGRIAEEVLDKEIPHSNYGNKNNYRLFDFLPGQPNPKSINKVPIRDGQWHSILSGHL